MKGRIVKKFPIPATGDFDLDSRYYIYLNKNYNIDFNTFCEFMRLFNYVVGKYDRYINLAIFFFKKNRLEEFCVNVDSTVSDRPFFKLYRSFKRIYLRRTLLKFVEDLKQDVVPEILSNFVVRFSSSSTVKYLNVFDLSNYQVLYLRKNKIFNKGRYSRNRQFYRTGVY